MFTQSFRLISVCLMGCVIVASAQSVKADPIFWLQSTDVAGSPAPLQISGLPSSAGTLYLFGSSDTVRVGAISFKLISSNTNALAFAAPGSIGPQSSVAWNNYFSVNVTPSLVTGIDAIAFPPSKLGFGPGSVVGNTMLLASVGYQLGTGSTSTISLGVGDAGVADSNGNPLVFHVGSSQSATLKGNSFGASASVGFVATVPEPSAIVLAFVTMIAIPVRSRRPALYDRV